MTSSDNKKVTKSSMPPIGEVPTINFGLMRVKTLSLATVCTLTCVLVFGGGGYLLDIALDKSPLLFIIGMVVAFVFTNVLIVFVSKKITKKQL
jgi:hypothetical protein